MNKIFLNGFFFLILFIAAAQIVILQEEIVGAAIFILLICFILIVCEDILATTLPFLLICLFVLSQYDSYSTFITFKWMLAPLIFALVFHFVVYYKKIKIGASFYGNAAVALAVSLGGIGIVSAAEYFNGATIYYIAGLGVGMLAVYVYIKAQIAERSEYDIRDKFITLIYIAGIFACFMVLRYYILDFENFWATKTLVNFQARNNISTFLMISLPIPFYFAIKNDLHMLSGFLMYGCIVLSGSRGGLVFGTVEMLFCLIYLIAFNKKKIFYACFTVILIAFGVYAFSFVNKLYEVRISGGLISIDEARAKLLIRSIDDFKSSPIFGKGLGYSGNSDLYDPRKFAMNWYHMMLPQII
ncbi:MAG: O-antigen ligase family protein, partial [Clostridia bacterium]